MANFQISAVTENGVQLKSHVDVGAVFTATRIVIGSGYIPTGKTAKTMTDVVSPVKELTINKKERSPDGRVVFGGVYTNEGVNAEFYFRELALYAKAVYPDGTEVDEVLYCYLNAAGNAELMAAYSTGEVVERQMDIVTFIGNEAQVDLTIESGVFMTQEQAAERFAPAGFGLGTTAKGISNTDLLDTLRTAKSGWYRGHNVTNAPSAAWYYFQVIADSTNFAYVLAYKYDGMIYKAFWDSGKFYGWAKLYDQDNKPTYSDVGAAPDGYGLGWSSTLVTDMDTTVRNGFYRTHGTDTINLPNGKVGHFVVINRAVSDSVTQIYFAHSGNEVLIRHRNPSGEWSAWADAASYVGAVAKTGDQTMSGSLTARSLTATDGVVNVSASSDGAMGRGQLLAKDTKTGKAGAILFGYDGAKFMDSDGYEYRIVHEGNIGQFLGVAPATVE